LVAFFLIGQSSVSGHASDASELVRDVAAFEKAAPGSEQEKTLRARLESGFHAARGRPAPDAAIAYEGRAEAAVQMAKSPADFLIAANEFEKAIQIAPWVAAYHFNRGVVLEKAEKYAEAAKSLDLYLLSDPDAKDAREVTKKIAGLRFKQELAARPAPPPAVPSKLPLPSAPALAGAWKVRTWMEFSGRPTFAGRWSGPDGTAQVSEAQQRFHATSRHNQLFVMVLDGLVSGDRISGTAILNRSADAMCRNATNQFGFEGTIEPGGRRIVIEVKGGVSVTFPGGREHCTFEPSFRALSIMLER
jgi:tetratricopeptide (TPR) repeat protein